MMFTEKWPLLHSTWQGVLLLAPQLLQAQLLLRIQLWPSCQPFSMACDLKRGVGVPAYDRFTGCRPHDTK